MRLVIGMVVVLAACAGKAPPDLPGSDSPDGGGTGTDLTCPLPMLMNDTGALTAFKAQMCNVSGSMGASHWYRMSAVLPAGPLDYVQLELWDNTGAFAGATVHTGTFPIMGPETDYQTCGVCVRAIGGKGTPDQHEYFATGGSVTIDAVGADGAPISATLTNIGLGEVDSVNHMTIATGCRAGLTASQISGTIMAVGGGGGSGGGGGGGGGACPVGVGD